MQLDKYRKYICVENTVLYEKKTQKSLVKIKRHHFQSSKACNSNIDDFVFSFHIFSILFSDY